MAKSPLPEDAKGNPRAASTRLELLNASRVAGQRRHDMRIGRQPDYVDPTRNELNRVLLAPASPAELDKSASLQTPKAVPGDLNASDAFALCAASHRPHQGIVFTFSSYTMDVISVEFRSQSYPDNNMTFRMRLDNGLFLGDVLSFNPDVLSDLISDARAFVDPVIQDLPSSQNDVTFTDEVIKHWDDVIETHHQTKDFFIDVSDDRVCMKRGEIPILILERDDQGINGVNTHHSGLDPQRLNGCLKIVKDAILLSPRNTPSDIMGLSEEDIGRMAARELSDVDFGYGM